MKVILSKNFEKFLKEKYPEMESLELDYIGQISGNNRCIISWKSSNGYSYDLGHFNCSR